MHIMSQMNLIDSHRFLTCHFDIQVKCIAKVRFVD